MRLLILLAVVGVLPVMAIKIPLRREPRSSVAHRAARNVIKEPLSKGVNMYSYNAEFGFGTPRQNLSIQIDTGSHLTLVVCNCSTRECLSGGDAFRPELSATFVNSANRYPKTCFVDNTCYSGHYFMDVSCFGSLCTNASQRMICVDSIVGGKFSGSGLIGLSKVTESPIRTLLENKECTEKVLALRLDPKFSGGEMSICEIDHDAYEGELSWVTNTESNLRNDWTFPVHFSYQKEGILLSVAILDSGTSLIAVPAEFYAQVYGTNHTTDCSQMPQHPLRIMVGNITVTLEPNELFMQLNESHCKPTLMPVPHNSPGVLLGDIFMQKVYVVHDFRTHMVGLALSKKRSAPTQQ